MKRLPIRTIINFLKSKPQGVTLEEVIYLPQIPEGLRSRVAPKLNELESRAKIRMEKVGLRMLYFADK